MTSKMKKVFLAVLLYITIVGVVSGAVISIVSILKESRDLTEISAGDYVWVNLWVERCPDVAAKLKHYMEDEAISNREYRALSDLDYSACVEPQLLKYKRIVQEKAK